MKKLVLFLNENPVPKLFTRGTVSAKELRLRSAIPEITEVHLLAPSGFYVASHRQEQTPLEEKVVVHSLFPCPYYFRPIPLFIQGLYLSLKLKPVSIEAESPHLSGIAAVMIGRLIHRPSLIEIRATYEQLLRFRFKFLPLKLKQAWLNLVQSFTLRWAAGIICNSLAYKQCLEKSGFASVVINPGLQYAPHLKPRITPNHPLTIGYLGRLVPEKGIDWLILAASKLSREGTVPPFRVEIAGLGPEKLRLEKLVSSLSLGHLVTFLGLVDNYTVLREWDLMVNPCLVNHPLEMVNAEAAHMGVPVVCFGNQDIPETVQDGITGIKVTQKSEAALTLTLRNLLTHPDLLHSLKAAGPAFAAKNYAFEIQVARLTAFYHKLGVL